MSLCIHNSDPLRWCKPCREFEALAHEERKKRYPTVLADVTCGFYCPPGWLPRVELLCDLLERLGGVQCQQVKEKFGGLRFYFRADTPEKYAEASALVHACEAVCSAVCLYCGGPGKLLGTGWWRTLCDSCDADYRQGRR